LRTKSKKSVADYFKGLALPAPEKLTIAKGKKSVLWTLLTTAIMFVSKSQGYDYESSAAVIKLLILESHAGAGKLGKESTFEHMLDMHNLGGAFPTVFYTTDYN
jgi:hypothetical protein